MLQNGAKFNLSKMTNLTFLSMYSTSEGKLEFCTSNSVRSASSREGGGSLGCRVGGSFFIRNILQFNNHGRGKTSSWVIVWLFLTRRQVCVITFKRVVLPNTIHRDRFESLKGIPSSYTQDFSSFPRAKFRH